MVLHRARSSNTLRGGFSLLEVLVAVSIFLFSMIVIGRLVIVGSDRALDVQQRGQAALLCQAKLAEVVVGAVPLSSQSEVPFDEDSDWIWTLDCEEASVTGLWNVTIRVTRARSESSRVECTLSQMVLDPSLRGSTMDAALAASSQTTTDTGTTDPSTSGSSTSGGSSTSSGSTGSQGSTSSGSTSGQSGGSPSSGGGSPSSGGALPSSGGGSPGSSSSKKGG